MRELEGKSVLLVVETFAIGGAEGQALNIARFLAEHHGVRVSIWSLFARDDVPLTALLERYHIPYRCMRLSWVWRRSRLVSALVRRYSCVRFALQLRQHKPDYILSYTTLPNIVCGLGWRLSGAKRFIWNQCDAGIFAQPGYLETLAIRLTPGFIANSALGAAWLRQERFVASSRIHIVDNGFTPAGVSDSRDIWRQRLHASERTVVVVMAANLHSPKDPLTAIKAWMRLAPHFRELHMSGCLVFAGRADDPVMMGAVMDALKNGNSESQVHLLGYVDDMHGLLLASDIAILSSCSEGAPYSILEAMAAGLPIVASNLEGIVRLLGSDEWTIPVGDDAGFAGALLRLARDLELRKALGEQNRARANKLFSLEAMVENTINVLLERTNNAPPLAVE